MKYAFFPGCSLSATALPYGLSTDGIARLLGLDMAELNDWNCCGASVFPTLDEPASLNMAGRNLALAEKTGLKQMVTPCPGCHHALANAGHELAERPERRRDLDEMLAEEGLTYSGDVEVRHLLDVLLNDVGLDAIKARVTQPLNGLKVACYYGCLLTRPPDITGSVEPENPLGMERLMTALGAEPFDWSYKTECCGAFFSLPRPDLGVTLTERVLANAREVGAEVVVTGCPVCQGNLDKNQGNDDDEVLPVLYFTELLGVACGLAPKALGLGRHFQDPVPALRRRSLVS